MSGEGHDSSFNVSILAHTKEAFGDLDVIRSADLVNKLVADPERPWAEWKHGKPLTQKQLAGLLAPFGITSEEVHPAGQAHGKGYKRVRFEEAWAVYCPGQNPLSSPIDPSEARNRANADEMGTSSDFRSAQEEGSRGSKNGNISHSHAGLRGCADRKPENGAKTNLTTTKPVPAGDPWSDLGIPPFLQRYAPERLGAPAISSGPDDDLGDFE